MSLRPQHLHSLHVAPKGPAPSDPDELALFGVGQGLILLSAGLLIGFGGRRKARLLKTFENLPLEKMRSAAMGPCQVLGKAAAWQGSLVAPFSGKPCLWYRWEVRQYGTFDGDDERRSTLVAEGASQELFGLEDNEGAIGIAPADATFYGLPEPDIWGDKLLRPGAAGRPQGPQALAWLDEHSQLRGDREAREWILRAGEPVHAAGMLTPGEVTAADYRPILRATNTVPLTLALREDLDVGSPSALRTGFLRALAWALGLSACAILAKHLGYFYATL
jgi:hypothetical protein